jgi:hypothetical protein
LSHREFTEGQTKISILHVFQKLVFIFFLSNNPQAYTLIIQELFSFVNDGGLPFHNIFESNDCFLSKLSSKREVISPFLPRNTSLSIPVIDIVSPFFDFLNTKIINQRIEADIHTDTQFYKRSIQNGAVVTEHFCMHRTFAFVLYNQKDLGLSLFQHYSAKLKIDIDILLLSAIILPLRYYINIALSSTGSYQNTQIKFTNFDTHSLPLL